MSNHNSNPAGLTPEMRQLILQYVHEPYSLSEGQQEQCERMIGINPVATQLFEAEEPAAWQQLFHDVKGHSQKHAAPKYPEQQTTDVDAAECSTATRMPRHVSRRVILAVAAAVVSGVVGGWSIDRETLANQVTALKSELSRQLTQFRGLKQRLGLDHPVRFIGDGSGNDQRRPLFVDGTALRTKGWVSTIRELGASNIRAMQLEFAPISDGDAADPEWNETLAFEIEAGSDSTPFDVTIPIPADRRTRKVTIRFIANEAAADLEELSPERLTFVTYVKCLETGPVAYADPAGGKPVPRHLTSIAVDKYYSPSGAMGSISDLSWRFVEGGAIRFVYQSQGRSPNDWGEFRYDAAGREKIDPCPYSGCTWLSPGNNWGTEDGGYDLRAFRPRRIVWEARAVTKPMQVSFFVGSLGKVWRKPGDGPPQWAAPQYPETLQQFNLGESGRTELSTEFQTFSEDLSSIPEDQFARVVCGFGWLISGGLDGELREFEVRNIRFEK